MYTNSTGGLDNAEWGTICDNNWDIQDARVVCHQLGYPDAVAAPLFAHYSQGSGPIWLNNVQCFGNESDIFACAHDGIIYHSCKHDEDASAECSGMPNITCCTKKPQWYTIVMCIVENFNILKQTLIDVAQSTIFEQFHMQTFKNR